VSTAAQQLLNSFELLPEADKHDVAVAILKRVASTSGDLSDDALVNAAEELFRAMDAELSRG
jgi:hypothetical protein